MLKSTLRQQKKLARENLSTSQKAFLDQKIYKLVIQFLRQQPQEILHVALFLSCNVEVNTVLLLRFLLKKRYHVYLPAIDSNKKMVFREINKINFYREKKYGFYQPTTLYKTVDPQVIQLFFVPLVAYDLTKNRLGSGKGYYDQYFSNLDNCQKVGLAYSLQKCDQIPIESHDIKLTNIITDQGIV